MELKEILNIVVIPISLALLALIWPAMQSENRRCEFKALIFRELKELSPYPKNAQHQGWWEHQNKNFIHQKIFQNSSENLDFILSLNPELVYFVSQLWEAKNDKNATQWLNYLKELSEYKEIRQWAKYLEKLIKYKKIRQWAKYLEKLIVWKYDESGEIVEIYGKWKNLCEEYDKIKK
jgi:Zn-dependent M16 (insulinase) family peptidase